MNKSHHVVALIFDDYETLDLHGPIEMLGRVEGVATAITLVAEKDVITSSQGTRILSDRLVSEPIPCDMFMTIGGVGTRSEIDNQKLLTWIVHQCEVSEKVFTVCTGAALLARAGVLDGIPATTNKLAYDWVVSLNDKVLWQRKARWVNHGKFLTSSGVAAGTDASLAYIAERFGYEQAKQVERVTEYIWNENADDDPYA
ncbi:DJ-1/PfpI family protein [Vibrio panuliri]|uniref:Thiamine biosynthesis protein ThiJ n=1 Tax=Vibrio panuliri TaxID=1381081 RepID=A0ABX3F6G5_9VIBR|nr:DJ-1/PfpI family protein [Vibrio panuliri]OLQ85772.1 thiamine biosynthesis protein ThiJ [Vibrio panuliri]